MNSYLNMLLRAGISAAATDRADFVERVGATIEEKIGGSPERAEALANGIETLLENLDHKLVIDQIINEMSSIDSTKNSIDTSAIGDRLTSLETKIDRLSEAIEKLNTTISSK